MNQKECNLRIMAVDDEPIVHRMVKSMIDESDLPVQLIGCASSGRKALELAAELRPDVCLLDIHMAEMDGLDLAARLHEKLDYSPRIIYLTAYSRFDYAQRAMRLGADDYILKPINRGEFIAALRRVIDSIKSERPIESNSAPAEETRIDAITAHIKRYVEQNYREKLSLTTAAEQVNLSPGYLGTIFKSAAGISFRAYLRSVRIAKAKELMCDPTLNVTEVARKVGYDEVNYFSEAFLLETGLRPSDYRSGGKRWAK
ncbi:MAG: response regulator transcription factor [Armatimonadota bacterium]